MKNNKGLLLALAFLAIPAMASLRFFNSSDAYVGNLSELKCSTGLTCTIVNGQLVAVSSPTLTGTSLALSTTLGVTGATTLSSTLSVAGLATLTGGALGDGSKNIVGFLSKQVAATATTITAAQCGSTFYNTGAVVINLPLASGVLGCKLTFITANASNFDVNPNDLDQILVLTNATGDAIRNATLGNTVTLLAGAALEWFDVAEKGTWSDIN